MVQSERYPVPFRAPNEIEKYEPSLDPSVWIDSYFMAMGIAGHTDLLAARYLPFMMDGDTRQWVNTLELNIIDSWEEMHTAFVNHFESSYSRTTSIEGLEHCVQGRNESTRSWVKCWQELWRRAYDIHQSIGIHCFKNGCHYEPLVSKIRRDYRLIKIVADIIDIGKRYAEEDLQQGSDDESNVRRNCRHAPQPDLHYSNTRQTGGKRRSDYNFDLVTNIGPAQRDRNYSR
jgi:hypothetical protein